MGAVQYEPIKADDFNELKALVKTEMKRRGKTEGTSQNYSKGSMAAYAGTAYDYEVVPESGGYIKAEHIQKITQCLDAATGLKNTPDDGAIISAEQLINATSVLSTLVNCSERSTSTGCASACSGLCSSGCYSSCTGCSGCGGCGGCTGCGGCDSGCYGSCKNDCKGDCGTSCTNLFYCDNYNPCDNEQSYIPEDVG